MKSSFDRYCRYQLPRVLTQLDRDPDSPTFGCFDRQYWHYKIRDFPSAILQQGIFALELLRTDAIASDKYRQSQLESWCVGAINALSRQVDSRGRVDEYYPFEASYPAAAFGLYAVCRVLWDWQQNTPELVSRCDRSGLERLSRHLAGRREPQAANQQAAGLAGLALAVQLELVAPETANLDAIADLLFSSQHAEGWFEEYGGADFGYLTVTLDALADYYEATGDRRALEASDRAIAFLGQLVGADGRLPSTLNSRNTDYVVPYGLVKNAARNPLAAWLVETLFAKCDRPEHFFWATDDRYHCHYIFASIARSLPHLDKMLPGCPPEWENSLWLPGCGYWIVRSRDRDWSAFVAAKKGGLIRIHCRERSPLVEFGVRVSRNGNIWTNNWHSQHWQITLDAEKICIEGNLQRVGFLVPNPYKHVLLRGLAFFLRAKLIPLLKRVAIFRPGNADGPHWQRTIEIGDRGIRFEDVLDPFPGAQITPSPRQNLRHVASADSFSVEEWSPLLQGAIEISPDTRER